MCRVREFGVHVSGVPLPPPFVTSLTRPYLVICGAKYCFFVSSRCLLVLISFSSRNNSIQCQEISYAEDKVIITGTVPQIRRALVYCRFRPKNLQTHQNMVIIRSDMGIKCRCCGTSKEKPLFRYSTGSMF